MSLAKTIGVTAFSGGGAYLIINLLIVVLSGDKGIVGKFFSTGGFIYPLLIGVIYGCAFGMVYSKVRGS